MARPATNISMVASTGNEFGYLFTDYVLAGPDGTVLQQGGLNNTVLTVPTTGQYTLVLEGNANSGVSLALTPIVNPAPANLTIGADTGGSLLPQQVAAYSFTLANPTTLVLSSDQLGTASFALMGPNGTITTQDLNALAANYPSAPEGSHPFISLAAGTYTVQISNADANNPTNYAFTLFDLATATPLALDTVVSGSLAPSTSTAAYTVDVTAGTTLRLLTSGADVFVLDPNGMPLNRFNDYRGTGFTADLTGSYTILVEQVYYASANYTLEAYADPAPTPLALGQTVSGSLADGNTLASYTFTLATSTGLIFDSLTNDGSTYWALSGPNGFYTSNSFAGSDGFNNYYSLYNAAPDGAYTLTVTSDNGGNYAFRLLDTSTATPAYPRQHGQRRCQSRRLDADLQHSRHGGRAAGRNDDRPE